MYFKEQKKKEKNYSRELKNYRNEEVKEIVVVTHCVPISNLTDEGRLELNIIKNSKKF